MRSNAGTTLLEMVVVIGITAILAGALSVFMVAPLRAYVDVNRRAALVDVAETSLRRMARDTRLALPNSLRVAGGGTVLELLHTAEGVKYRRSPGIPHTTPSDWLFFGPAGDTSWNVLGRFGALSFTYGSPLPAGTRLAVYTTGTSVYSDAALGSNPGVITPAGTSVTINLDGDEDQIALDSAFQFRFESPEQRMYVVEGPVTYLCDLAAGTLTRYVGYAIQQAQPTLPAAAPLATAASARVADRVTACSFDYQPGSLQRSALLTLELSLAEAGEQVRLLHQIHVENLP